MGGFTGLEAATLGRTSCECSTTCHYHLLDSWLTIHHQIVVTILVGAMILTRRRRFKIFGGRPGPYRSTLDVPPAQARSTDELLHYDTENEDDKQPYTLQEKQAPKTRSCCGAFTVSTPNSSRFKNHIHSRILQRFPFLIEMFYWVLNFLFYKLTFTMANELFKETGIWQAAQDHGIAIMETEEFSWLSFLFPIKETEVQGWFMNGHQDLLSVLNKTYALIHIPGTVGFIAWYYYAAPSHPTFATVRRTMTLTNLMAFVTFTLYPTMPPRLLPKEYGFLDTVSHDHAQSVWQSGTYVNSLAAMPSMHFGYAFCIGCTFIYQSGILRSSLEKNERRKNLFWKVIYLFVGVAYPSLILVTIVATANHYFLDALVAFFYVLVAYMCNRILCVFLPLEDWLLWVLRLEKPIPSTGERMRERGGNF